MKKSIFASLIFASLMLVAGVSYPHSCRVEPKTEITLTGDSPKLIVAYSAPGLVSAQVLILKGYDMATIEPEIGFVNVMGAKETFAFIANSVVKPAMYRLPNSYG